MEGIITQNQVINSIRGEGKDVEEAVLHVLRNDLLFTHIPVIFSVLEDDN